MMPPFLIRYYRQVLWIFFLGTFFAGVGGLFDPKLFLHLSGKEVSDPFFLKLAMLLVGLFGLPYLFALSNAKSAGILLAVGAAHKICVSLFYHWHIIQGDLALTFLLVSVGDGLMGLIDIYYIWMDPTTFEPYQPERRVSLRDRGFMFLRNVGFSQGRNRKEG